MITSLLDTDFYKLKIAYFAWKLHCNINVTFAVQNRTKSIRLAEIIPINALRQELEEIQKLRFTREELAWISDQGFEIEFVNFLANCKLPDFKLEIDEQTSQFILEFNGNWPEVTLWEIYSLSTISELKSAYTGFSLNSILELDMIVNRAFVRLDDKLQILSNIKDLKISDFGTRRRFSFDYQESAIQFARLRLGDKFIGTSNCYFAMKYNLKPIGTTGHELAMVYAALADNDTDLKNSQYEVYKNWSEVNEASIFLPDTFGSTQFLKNAPEYMLDWAGVRVDSKDIYNGRLEIIDWYIKNHRDPRFKNVIFADGLDVNLGINSNGEDIISFNEYNNYLKTPLQNMSFGWGTNLTNGFKGLYNGLFDPISLVCKVKEVNEKAAVKMSDNYQKMYSSDPKELDRYVRVFGIEGMENNQTNV